MSKNKVDLRSTEWREAIVYIANSIKNTPLTERALCLLISDASGVKMTDVREVLRTIPKLSERYLKEAPK